MRRIFEAADIERRRVGDALVPRLGSLVALWRDELSRRAGQRGRRASSAPRGSGASPRGGLRTEELEAAAAALLRLQRGLTGARDLAGSSYMDDPELLGAYLLYYWPVSYLQAALALPELPPRPRRIMDLGSGPGSAAAALFDAGAEDLVLVDGSSSALALAERILSPAPATNPRAEPGPGQRHIELRLLDLESSAPLPSGPFDAIVLGHSLNELWKGRTDRLELRLGLLERAAGLLAEGGFILVIEPALLATSREALALRNALAAQGHAIVGPCPGSYSCPALDAGPDRTCHAEAPWEPPEPIASLARAAGLDRQSVKCTWFAAGRAGTLASDQAARRVDGPAGIERARVVSDPMLNKAGRVRYFLCSPGAEGRGALTALSARKDDEAARRLGFFSLRRFDWVRVSGAEGRAGGGLGLLPGSRLDIPGRAPVP